MKNFPRLKTPFTIICFVLLSVVLLTGCTAERLIYREGNENNMTPQQSTSDFMVDTGGYAYSMLDPDEKLLYDRMNRAIASCDTELKGLRSYSFETVSKVQSSVLIDHPEYIWSQGAGVFTNRALGNLQLSAKYELTYLYSAEIAYDMISEVDNAAETLLSSVNPDASDYDKMLAVYRYLVFTTKYDSEAASSEEDDQYYESGSLYGVLVNGKAICQGYAKAAQYLLARLGIESVFVTGESERQSHAWILAKLDGEYYYVDPTWADPITSVNDNSNITYAYFCMTTEQMLRDHTPDKTLELPQCTATDCNYFVRNGLLFDSYSYDTVANLVAQYAGNSASFLQIAFASRKAADEAVEALFKGGDIFKAFGRASRNAPSLVIDRYVQSYDPTTLTLKIYLNYD